ncbi:hypothetical protein CIL05_02275 [Virgibacillus profundi]|uniref:DUF4901 domain-containing protein n=1 Tax=Virgibacillus profundi TaxID=2024555 RepID=A0A2A2IK58_9BACI|nr:hypothetical protein [Virgibacillus profundi]PAV31503.1 hypothetical protein CIL05_02275 [Virgibacillus profundi]PXY55689.1 hypothetical protein CIT14_02285 [Virgibacillus profundi]
MHHKIKEIVDYTAEKFKLDNYYLKRHHIYQEKNGLNEESFVLNMEWFPSKVKHTDDDHNPAGTASIDVDIHTKLVRSIIFVQGVSYAHSNFPSASEKENIIEWVEEETGLEFGRQFRLIGDEERKLSFRAAVDNVAVYPAGSIDVKFNQEGQLVLFSIHGNFPNESQLNWEPFSLTPETTDPIAEEQFKLLEIPLEDEEKWKAVYGAPAVFVTNDGKRFISFEEVENQGSYVKKDVMLEWESQIHEEFTKESIDISLEVTIEQALANETNTDNQPLTKAEEDKAITETKQFMQREYPNDSEKWKLTQLHREHGYIFAELKPAAPDQRVIERKIKVVIDEENYTAINYFDNSVILDMFGHFESADEPAISKDTAFEKLRGHIDVTPVYVYDKEQESYILCGKIDCEYGVDAVTAEVILLDEL